MRCYFDHFEHIDCGDRSECERPEAHHHHVSPRETEVISPGTADECWVNTYIRRGDK